MRRDRVHQPDNALVVRWGAASLVKSIQRGTISLNGVLSNTATITSVDLANSVLLFLGASSNNAGDNIPDYAPRLALTNATTITATKFSLGGGGNTVVSYEVLEYWPGVIKSVQRGSIVLTNVATNTATITTVNTAKAHLGFLGAEIPSVSTQAEWPRLDLTNSTTVTATRVSAGAPSTTVGFQVVEWF